MNRIKNSPLRVAPLGFASLGLPRRSVRRPVLLAVAITLLAAGSLAASMAGLSWNNASGGAASTAANWSPAQVPTSADDLTFNLNNTYAVTYNASVPSSRTQTYRRGTVTLTATSPHTVTNGLTIGAIFGDIATATLATGAVISSGAVTVGDALGSGGTLNVNDDDADFITSTSAGDLTLGDNGGATMSITGGGLVSVAHRFTAGSNSSSSATVSVSGFSAAPPARSTLDFNGTGLPAAIGAGGDVTMNVSNGALADFAGSVNVAQGSTSTTTLTIAGVGLVNAQVDVGSDMNIARNQAAASAAGVATVSVNTGGALNVTRSLNVAGDPDGGTGTLHLGDGAAIEAGSLAVGAAGTLDLDGGALDVNGGTFTYTNPAVDFVLGGVDSPVVTLTGADATLQANAGARALTVGGGSGTNPAGLNFLSGSTLTIPVGDVVLGEASDNGSILFGLGTQFSMPPMAQLVVGQAGRGLFEANNGATITGGDLFIARDPGSVGFLLTESSGTVADFQHVYVGGSDVAAGGAGRLWANSGSILNVDGAGTNLKVWHPGVLDVSGTLNSPGTIQVFGDANVFDSGKITAQILSLESGSVLTGRSGTVDAKVFANTGSLITAVDGDLTLGNPASVDGFIGIGTINVSDRTITILDANPAIVNTATLSGGALVVPNGMTIAIAKTVSGFGTIDGDIFNSGTITSTGTGLTFKGTVLGAGLSMGGALLRFVEGGGFTGNGVVNAPIIGDATSSITAAGALAIGDSTSVDGFRTDGTLDVGAFPVSLRTSHNAHLGRLTTISGGTLTCNGEIAVHASMGSATLTGFGQVTAPTLLVSTNGRVEPGSPIGTLNVTGDYVQDAEGTLSVQLAGGAPIAKSDGDAALAQIVVTDRLDVSGTASLAGTLRIERLHGLVIANGDSFPILTCAARSATFDSVVFEQPYLDAALDVVYTPTAVVLVARATTGVDLPPIGLGGDGTPDDGAAPGMGAVPARFGLRVSGRNPFTPDQGAAFEYDVPRAEFPVAVSVFDASGRRVADLVSGVQSAGTHSGRWNGSELGALPSGVYFLRMDAGPFGETRRLVMIR